MNCTHFVALLLLLNVDCLVVCQTNGSTTQHQYEFASKLVSDLLHQGYQKTVLPLLQSTKPLDVNFGMILQVIHELDEQVEVLSTMVWLNIAWIDRRLKWDPANYGDIQSLRLHPSEIWIPDIHPYNAASQVDYKNGAVDVVVSSDGSVLFVPMLSLRTYCSLDIEYYPFDTQVCMLKFGSWTYDGLSLNLKIAYDSMDITSLIPNKKWSLIEAPMERNVLTYECCVEPYIDVTAKIKMKRKPGNLYHLYMGPAVCLTLLVPTVFILPPESSHKMVLGGSLLISQVIVLTMLPESVPTSHLSPPKIVLFYLASIALMCMSLACSTLVVNMWERSKTNGTIPGVLRKVFLDVLGRVLCVRRENPQRLGRFESNVSTKDDDVTLTERGHVSSEWRQLAVVVDRLLLVLFIVCCVLLVITMWAFSP